MNGAKPARHETVTIQGDIILLHPGTKLTKPDRQALNQILSTYHKSLFRVETYKDGKVTRTQGQLSEALIDKTIAAEAAQAKASGNSHVTLQIIAATTSEQLVTEQAPAASPSASTNPQRIQGPTPTATPPPNAMPSASTNPQRSQTSPIPGASTNPEHQAGAVGEKASRELIERLKPILEKYTKK